VTASSTSFNLPRFASRHIGPIKTAVFLLSLIPTVHLIHAYHNDGLGINPLQTLLRSTGSWGLIFLLLSLTVTPLRRSLNRWMIHQQATFGKRLSDWNWIIKLRRMLGLFCFFYCSLHLGVYLWFDQGLDWEGIVFDLQDRPYILLGGLCYLMLVPLALTSNRFSIRVLKKNWLRLHKSTYAITLASLVHFWWLSKVGVWDALPYSLVATLLLGYRVFAWRGWVQITRGDTGMEVRERPPASPATGSESR
jgi:sulfoxide reductase heme-binding subunit YedZ